MSTADMTPRGPDRVRVLDAGPAQPELRVIEWGEPISPPLALVHGGGDFARSFDGFAPRLAARGWRVTSWDHRGHGRSGRTGLYGYGADLRDASTVLTSVADGAPVVLVGHSKGGVQAIEVAAWRPDLVRAVVSIDGFVRRRGWSGPVPPALGTWLDARRKLGPFRAGSRATLAARRGKANPRLDRAWLEHLVDVGTDVVAGTDELRWQLDPVAFPGPPHGWSAQRSLELLRSLTMPFLGLRAGVDEASITQPGPADIERSLPPDGRLEVLEGLGHFAHVEAPERVVDAIDAFCLARSLR